MPKTQRKYTKHEKKFVNGTDGDITQYYDDQCERILQTVEADMKRAGLATKYALQDVNYVVYTPELFLRNHEKHEEFDTMYDALSINKSKHSAKNTYTYTRKPYSRSIDGETWFFPAQKYHGETKQAEYRRQKNTFSGTANCKFLPDMFRVYPVNMWTYEAEPCPELSEEGRKNKEKEKINDCFYPFSLNDDPS